MSDVTENWHMFSEAEGAEYLAAYVTIWHCLRCDTVAGAQNEAIEWVMEPEGALDQD